LYPVAAINSPLDTCAFPGTDNSSLLPTVFEYFTISATLLYKSLLEFSSVSVFVITTLIFPVEFFPSPSAAALGTSFVIADGFSSSDFDNRTFFFSPVIYALSFESNNNLSPFLLI